VPDTSRVAVVDDDVSVRQALGCLLRAVGFGVETFASAKEFLHSGQPSRFDCLVLDVQMSGMSGVELRDHLLASGTTAPIVFITAHAELGMRTGVTADGATQLLEKPFSDDALLEAIDASIGRSRA